jgi:peptide/nickel transport system ATP-binding protein
MKAVLRILPVPPARIVGGQVLFEAHDILRMSSEELNRVRGKGISMVFQDPIAALNPVFPVGSQLSVILKSRASDRSGLSNREIHERIASALSEVALPDPERQLKSYPFQLSGGMRQRVCIAMALLSAPKLLIADEPGTSLDVTIQDQILRLLDHLVDQRSMSLILISHSLGVVRERTDRVYVMYAGSMVETAPTADLFTAQLHPYSQALMGAVPRLTGRRIAGGIPGRMPSYLHPPSGCRFQSRCPRVMTTCKTEIPSLRATSGDHEVACHLY